MENLQGNLSESWWLVPNSFERYAKVKLGENLPQGLGVKNRKIFELPPPS